MYIPIYVTFLMSTSRPQKMAMQFPFYIFGIQPNDGFAEVAETCSYDKKKLCMWLYFFTEHLDYRKHFI